MFQARYLTAVESEVLLGAAVGAVSTQASYLNAARYSTSPMGGSSPPVKAMFTLKPTPVPLPTYEERTRLLD